MMSSSTRVAKLYLAYHQGGEEITLRFQAMLGILRALAWSYQTAHWQATGVSAYGDHLLFERLYDAALEEIDVLAEKAVGYLGPSSVDPVVSLGETMAWVEQWSAAESDLILRMLQAENDLQVVFKAAYDALKASGGLTLGLDDWIMATSSAHDSNVYLLQQRAGSSRVASAMTAEGYFTLPLEHHSVRDFAKSKALTNDKQVARTVNSEPAQIPTPSEINHQTPGSGQYGTLTRFVVNTADLVPGVPEHRDELPTHKDRPVWSQTCSIACLSASLR